MVRAGSEGRDRPNAGGRDFSNDPEGRQGRSVGATLSPFCRPPGGRAWNDSGGGQIAPDTRLVAVGGSPYVIPRPRVQCLSAITHHGDPEPSPSPIRSLPGPRREVVAPPDGDCSCTSREGRLWSRHLAPPGGVALGLRPGRAGPAAPRAGPIATDGDRVQPRNRSVRPRRAAGPRSVVSREWDTMRIRLWISAPVAMMSLAFAMAGTTIAGPNLSLIHI